jgi:hypothetical protein
LSLIYLPVSIVVEFAKESRPRREPYDGDRNYGYARHMQHQYIVKLTVCVQCPSFSQAPRDPSHRLWHLP